MLPRLGVRSALDGAVQRSPGDSENLVLPLTPYLLPLNPSPWLFTGDLQKDVCELVYQLGSMKHAHLQRQGKDVS